MNILFLTQSFSLDLFHHLGLALKERKKANQLGFYVADSHFFEVFERQYASPHAPEAYLKEWEIIKASKHVKPDLRRLKEYEEALGEPYLWNALVADRRIYWGKKYAYAQDYKPRFSHERMLAILQVGLEKMEAFFDRFRPDCIVGFQCVTLGDYLAHLIAKHRNIPYLNLRPTRVKNYIYAGADLLEPSEELARRSRDFYAGKLPPDVLDESVEFLSQVKKVHALYEGVILPQNKPPAPVKSRQVENKTLLLKVMDLVRLEFGVRFGRYRDDNHLGSYWDSLIHQKIIRPLRARFMARAFRDTYVTAGDLSSLEYAFFPLHTEPEVTLSVYSKPYLNQIEAIRLISHNLPVGCKLLVKEHPWSIGKRPLSYYRKLLSIPNVLLADPQLTSRELITHSQLVAVIAGSIAFEAAMMGKPAVTLGRAPFNILPQTMLVHAENPDQLGHRVRWLLKNYEYDEKALLAYIGAVIDSSVSVDFYTKLLGRTGAYSPGSATEDQKAERQKQVHLLADYLVSRQEHFVADRQGPVRLTPVNASAH